MNPAVYPAHEPSNWLRLSIESLAARIAARDRVPAGMRLIVSLVPASGICARCETESETTVYHRCGQEAESLYLPAVVLRVPFTLCAGCATKEYGPDPAREQSIQIEEESHES